MRGTMNLLDTDILLADLRRSGVVMQSASVVSDYLRAYPDTAQLVSKAIAGVRKHIPDACIFLDLYSDPEIDDQYLVLVVRVPAYDKNFMARLEEAEAEYIEQLGSSTGWLQLTTDFQPPETTDTL